MANRRKQFGLHITWITYTLT